MSVRARVLALVAQWLRGRGHFELAEEMLSDLKSNIPGVPTDLTGKRIGRLLVIGLVGSAPRRWRVKCDCGVEKIIDANFLLRGATQSCGCWRSARVRVMNRTHGRTKTRTYRIWVSMLRRAHHRSCGEIQNRIYENVSVTPRWLRFESFLEDMGECPSKEYSLDRWPNNAGDYEPGNCRWATRTQQTRNVKNNRILEIHGESLTVAEWAERTSIPLATIYARVYSGWPPERAVFGALQKGGGRVPAHT